MTSIQNEVETRWKCFDEIKKKKKASNTCQNSGSASKFNKEII